MINRVFLGTTLVSQGQLFFHCIQMIQTRASHILIAVALISVVNSALISAAYGERVGFQFQGSLLGSPAPITLFNHPNVPGNAPIVGTFSYDTNVSGQVVEPAVIDFGQTVAGGISMKIGTSLFLSAHDFSIRISDDFEIEPMEFVDHFGVVFERLSVGASARLFVDGNPWSNNAVVKVELFWPPETFEGGDEPKLTPDRPSVPGFSTLGLVGDSSLVKLFSVTSISPVAPLAADYNRDGRVDENDYLEWRWAYGESQPTFLYADGNNNQLVDTADYVLWRDHVASAATVPTISGHVVPEPTNLAALAPLLILLAVNLRRGH